MHISIYTIHLDANEGNGLFSLSILPGDAVYSFWDKFQDKVEVEFVRAALAIAVKAVLQLHDIGVLQPPHNLQLPVLKPPILQHLFDRHHLASLLHNCLEHDPERPIPDYSLGYIVQKKNPGKRAHTHTRMHTRGEGKSVSIGGFFLRESFRIVDAVVVQ